MPWVPPKRTFIQYAADIHKLLDQFLRSPDVLTPAALQEIEYSPEFQRLSEEAASRMIAQVSAQNARSWRAAARQSMRGREMLRGLQTELTGAVGDEMRRLVASNALQIQSIPSWLASKVTKYTVREQLKGKRPEAMIGELRKILPKLTTNRIKLIARTETMKSITALTQARAEHLGIEWYQWSTSKDSRVRKSHRFMDLVLVRFNDPPSPEALVGESSTLGHYNAGGCPNCRCDAQPVVALDEITWPARVYMDGFVQRMSRARFVKLSGLPMAA